ncbi:MAG: hypothetical protein V2A62_03725 [Candidatus Woesearchaeota archaeon]
MEKEMKTIHKILGLASLLIGLSAQAKTTGSIEVMAGDKSATLDVKVSGDLANKVGVFARARTSANYAQPKEVGYFTLVDITGELGGGFDAVGEVQFIQGVGPVPRFGFQYFGQVRGFSGYGLVSLKIGDNPNLELIAILKYQHPLTENLAVKVGVEHLTDLCSKGHEFSTQRIRIGLEIEGWHFGPAVDFTEAGQGEALQFDYNVGGFVRKEF